MTSPASLSLRRAHVDSLSDDAAGNLDVGWLLHSKKGHPQTTAGSASSARGPDVPNPTRPEAEPTPPQLPTNTTETLDRNQPSSRSQLQPNGVGATPHVASADAKSAPPISITPSTSTETPKHHHTRPSLARGSSNDENKSSAQKGPVGSLKSGGRRSSWMSSLSSKFSSSNPSTPSKTAGVDVARSANNQGTKSPNVEFGNPFNKHETKQEPKKDKEEKPVITPLAQPRRQSVLVQAGQETKLDSPSFLSSALRRLSSSNNTTLGKGAGTGAACPRKIMNVDQNRERVKISEFDQNKLKRVAFCVDVEIAGYAVQADENDDPATRARQIPPGQRVSLATLQQEAQAKKTGDAKIKDKGEGAALKNPQAATVEKEDFGETRADTHAALQEAQTPALESESSFGEDPITGSDPQPVQGTRKKEKKKRSEAERKERRERKRRHAEANGLVPLELTKEGDEDSDSSPSHTPPRASTPNIRQGNQPTTDPLRIYKRCCQLRETTALDRIKDQISKPSATLSESHGSVAVVDLSGMELPLQDIVTFGDWLAVVPVRKLILDDCSLTDEGLRVILSGLASCKTSEQAKQNRKLPKRGSGKRGQEQLGVVEKLSLKNNSNITNLGWKHIALFLHISRSLRAVDLSGIPFPHRSAEPSSGDLSRTTTSSSSSTTGTNNGPNSRSNDLGGLITRALSERFGGDRLEELILGRCELATRNVAEFVDCAIKCRIRRLGLADNNLSVDALQHVARYVKSGVCEGLDLGTNDLHGSGHLISDAVDGKNPLFAISLSDCKLTPEDLERILSPLTKLKNFKFIDLSRNPLLFSGSTSAVPVFRRLLPRLKELKRIHLCDVGMSSEHVIALAEIIPDCPALAHVSILDNASLVEAMNSKDHGAQEEACAFLASLMTAARVSHTIIAIEVEVPSADSSEVVKALSTQVVAYSLRNMEHSALGEAGISTAKAMPDKDTPEVLLHLVGHMEGYMENHDKDEPAPDDDYVIASTGIVKALGVCLMSQDPHGKTYSPTQSGYSTPRQDSLRPTSQKKPKNVALELCESARKIRMRLRPALIKEDRAGNMMDYRRLLALDGTLERTIQRFEEEYPETKVPALSPSPPPADGIISMGSSPADASMLSASVESNDLSKVLSMDDYVDETPYDEGDRESTAVKLSRTSSSNSLAAAKALTHEEGRMLRFGQSLRRDLLKPTGTDDFAHGTSVTDPPESPALAALRAKLETFQGEEIRRKVEAEGIDNVIRELGINADELMALQKEDPQGFEAFRDSQLAAQANAGMRPDPRDNSSARS